MSKFKRHFFVCLHDRPPGAKPSCGPRGGTEIYNSLMEGLGANQELWGQVNVTTTGCMGPCFDGPMVVCYPEAVWYAGVKQEDAAAIVAEHMVAGKPVERLVYEFPDEDD